MIADNGSTDGSIEIAEGLGARVVHVAQKGYGNALMGGINAAQGKYVIMGDADDSYNFLEIPKFVEQLRTGKTAGSRVPAPCGWRNSVARRYAVSPSLVGKSDVFVDGSPNV